LLVNEQKAIERNQTRPLPRSNMQEKVEMNKGESRVERLLE